jgi:hypothetical protein
MARETKCRLRINQGGKNNKIKIDMLINEQLLRRILNLMLYYPDEKFPLCKPTNPKE